MLKAKISLDESDVAGRVYGQVAWFGVGRYRRHSLIQAGSCPDTGRISSQPGFRAKIARPGDTTKLDGQASPPIVSSSYPPDVFP